MRKKKGVKIAKKRVKIAIYTSKSEGDSYSICAVAPVFITGRIRTEENECAFLFRRFQLKKLHFFSVALYKIWKKLSP